MKVRLIDQIGGEIKSTPVSSRDEAVKTVKVELGAYCQEGDRIVWYCRGDEVLPSAAVVIDMYDNEIDFYAVID